MTESKEKKQYTIKKYLNEEEFESFKNFIEEANIDLQELADFDNVVKRTVQGRIQRKRVEKKFAQDFAKSKKDSLEKQFKKLKFLQEA